MDVRLRKTEALGRQVAEVLAGSWRVSPPPVEFSEKQLEAVTPLLLGSGAGALGWWRVRNSTLSATPSGLQLQEAYRMHALHSALHEKEIKEVITLLGSSDIEAVLVKGWAVARHYPEKGLRPYGDIDLCIGPGQISRAINLMSAPEGSKYYVDLHDRFAHLDGLRPELLDESCEVTKIDEVEVKVLGFEDQLRILCTHALRHGMWRPLWLCDIAAMVEFRPPSFDWTRCLGDDERVADWVACAIGLANQLLSADVEGTPVADRARKLPDWLVTDVLRNFSAPYPELYPPMAYSRPLMTYLRRPRGLLKTLRVRWPDPIEATIRLRGPFNDSPRLPFQIRNVASRVRRLMTQSLKRGARN